MVINSNDAKKEDIKNRRLDDIERSIDAELKTNEERLNQGREVMIPCIMPFNSYANLISEYTKNGWIVRHEKINVYGRIYFRKAS